MNQTYDIPTGLSNLQGAYDSGHWEVETREIKAGLDALNRGTVLAVGTGADAGELVTLTAGTEANAYGVLLDPSMDTSQAFSDGSVSGSVARAGSFRGAALIVPVGINAVTLTDTLRKNGIFVEGAITVPPAA